MACIFCGAGVAHFAAGPAFVAIVPPGFPSPRTLVAVSGACEILGGCGMLLPATRRTATYGLLALLVAVFPANIWMALDAPRFASLAPPWALWLRLPFQGVLMALVWSAR